jgi:hypothetical protein
MLDWVNDPSASGFPVAANYFGYKDQYQILVNRVNYKAKVNPKLSLLSCCPAKRNAIKKPPQAADQSSAWEKELKIHFTLALTD